MRQRPQSLNRTFGLLLGTVIVPLLLGSLALLYVQTRQEQRAAHRQLSVIAHALVEAVEREFDVGRQQLEVLASTPMVDAADWRQLHEFAGRIAARTPGTVIGLAGPDGQQIFNTITAFGSPQPNLWRLGQQQKEAVWEGHTLPLSSQTLTQEVFRLQKASYSDLYYGMNTRKPALAISIPVRRSGAVQYALTMSFPPERLQQLVAGAVFAPELRASVVDRRGLVIASNAASVAKLADAAVPLDAPPGAMEGTFERRASDGVLLSSAFVVSAENGFQVRVSRPAQGFGSFIRSASAGWLALVLAALLASVSMARHLARRIALPLQTLGQAVRSGEVPDLPRTRIEEIDLLAGALRAGALAERERRDNLVREAQRAEAETALRRADRQKDEFLATLAHELRNPLAPLRNAAEIIRLAAPSDPRVQRSREIIERQVAHLTRLVDDLLDVSRITLGTVHLKQEPVDLVALARATLDAMRPAIAAARLTLHESYPQGQQVLVQGDALRLSQCMSNLLNNAVKFTPAGGRIDFSLACQAGVAQIEVADDGIGIAADSLLRIFEFFVQENRSGLAGNSGLGIGLALTHKLVHLHGGSIQAYSEGRGRGSRFVLRLPALNTEEHAAAPRPDLAEARGLGRRVLVVDDNQDAADSLAEMLQAMGFETSVAYSGQAACTAVQAAAAPQAVLLDIGLPDVSGYELIGTLRTIAPGLVVVALTGWGQDADRERSRQQGFDAHLTKPADPQAVAQLLQQLLSRTAPTSAA